MDVSAKGKEPSVTNLVAHCQVCGQQWVVKSTSRTNAKGCSFCDAPKSAIRVENES